MNHPETNKSEEKLLGGLCHILVFFHLLGLVANLVIYLIHKDKSPFVANHAKQALGLQFSAVIFILALGALGVGAGLGFAFGGIFSVFGLAFLGGLAGLAVSALTLAALVCVIVGAVRGFSGCSYQYPLIGGFVDTVH